MQRKKNRWLLRAVLLMLVCSLMTMTVSLAAEAGTSGDPLVTLSYLNGTFLDSLLAKVDQKIDQRQQSAGLRRLRLLPARHILCGDALFRTDLTGDLAAR